MTKNPTATIEATGTDGTFYEALRTLRQLQAGTVEPQRAEQELHRAIALVVGGSGLHEDTVWDALYEEIR